MTAVKQLKLLKNALSILEMNFKSFNLVSQSKRTKNMLSGRLSILEDLFRQTKAINENLISLSDEDGLIKEIEEIMGEIMEGYVEYRAALMDCLDELTECASKITPAQSSSNTLGIRLPEMELPVFSGQYEKWRQYKSKFESMIHNNSGLSEIQKLHYLKSGLSGEADRLLQHLDIDEGNYEKAWSILCSRYENKRFLVNTHLKVLFNQPHMQNENSFGLKTMLDTTTECIHSLHNLGIPVKQWDLVIIYIIFQKLPPCTQQLWEERLGASKKLPSFEEFSTFLETRFMTLEVIDQQKPKIKSIIQKGATAKTAFHVRQNKQKEQFSCKVCGKGQHPIRTCNRFVKMNVVERYNMVQKIGVCSNCLAYSHITQQCPSHARCYFCQQKHHSLLHASSTHTTNMPTAAQPIDYQNHSTQHFSTPHSTNVHAQSYQVTANNLSHEDRPSTSGASRNHPTQHSFAPPQGTNVQAQAYQVALSNPRHEELPSTSGAVRNHLAQHNTNTHILLATALVRVKSSNGRYFHLRALLDPGSEATFITEAAVQMLNLKARSTFIEVSGLGKVSSGACHRYADISFGSLHSNFEIGTRAYVYKSLTGLLPAKQLTPNKWKHLNGLTLADPLFFKPATVDILLGTDIYPDIILPEIVRGSEVSPIAQNTQLGWILLGKVPDGQTISVHSFLQVVDVDTQLRKFWEIEEAPFQDHDTEENRMCEAHFKKTTKRLPSGRYEVSLPFKDGWQPALGSSKTAALRRFHQLERRFLNNPTLHREYSKCIEEYLSLGHMTEVDDDDDVLRSPFHYFVPHHAVMKESSSTTKLRVVFDAAAKCSDGTSLNERLLIGPKTQNNIIDIILKWRMYKVTFTADVEKMYRQIRMNQRDAYYQLIFWRKSEHEHLKMYRLDTVTFGTASAPYLAIRTLNQVALDEESHFPVGAQTVRDEMYVDDLISGADSVEDALHKRDEVRELLATAGFNLRKWTSNSQMVLEGIPLEQRELDFSVPFESSTEHINALGMRWFPIDDVFSFRNVCYDASQVPTKRTMLSTIARLFDPLGWLSPCIVKAKMFMQQLWWRGLTWDEPIPLALKEDWLAFSQELPLVENIQMPRWVNLQREQKAIEIHGFSDASEKAYGAAIYLRVLDSNNVIHVHLLVSKTRVAPLKTVTLPRLELCGAVMLATLLDYVTKILRFVDVRTYAWSDSTITLAWIMAPPSKWKTFVGNRVAEVQRLTNCNIWRHVPTLHNPADLASRGLLPSELNGNTLWWNGPEFLRTDWEFSMPNQPTILPTDEESRKIKSHCVVKEENVINLLIHRHSTLPPLIRILAYCCRFASNTRKLSAQREMSILSPLEQEAGLKVAVRTVQANMFFENSKDNKPNLKRIKSLHPFIDEENIIRVGGRLQNANLGYTQQHPIILKPGYHLTNLIINDAHEKTLHGSTQQMIAYLRTKYWILDIKRSVKKCIHRCNICFRHRAKPVFQLMGNLPAPRVRVSRAFSFTGVDYAGPIEVKAWKGRGTKMFKAYFAIFVCLATKAIHLELVSDMTTQAFIAAFRRFTSRRGNCKEIFSDCGKNFVGAAKELENLRKAANYDKKEVAEILMKDGVKWNFIPPASPHFGGLWEAGVKSVKYHLKRIAGNSILTFEELYTLLTQIEACLNSRPLCPLSSDPDDFAALTPAHFLIGEPTISVPEPNTLEENICCTERWKRIQQLYQTFWKQWSSEYLSRLQQRPKWLKTEPQPKIGDLVLVKDERIPPSKWIMARVIYLHPGADDLIRVVTLKTQNEYMKSKLQIATKVVSKLSEKKLSKMTTLPTRRLRDGTLHSELKMSLRTEFTVGVNVPDII